MSGSLEAKAPVVGLNLSGGNISSASGAGSSSSSGGGGGDAFGGYVSFTAVPDSAVNHSLTARFAAAATAPTHVLFVKNQSISVWSIAGATDEPASAGASEDESNPILIPVANAEFHAAPGDGRIQTASVLRSSSTADLAIGIDYILALFESGELALLAFSESVGLRAVQRVRVWETAAAPALAAVARAVIHTSVDSVAIAVLDPTRTRDGLRILFVRPPQQSPSHPTLSAPVPCDISGMTDIRLCFTPPLAVGDGSSSGLAKSYELAIAYTPSAASLPSVASTATGDMIDVKQSASAAAAAAATAATSAVGKAGSHSSTGGGSGSGFAIARFDRASFPAAATLQHCTYAGLRPIRVLIPLPASGLVLVVDSEHRVTLISLSLDSTHDLKPATTASPALKPIASAKSAGASPLPKSSLSPAATAASAVALPALALPAPVSASVAIRSLRTVGQSRLPAAVAGWCWTGDPASARLLMQLASGTIVWCDIDSPHVTASTLTAGSAATSIYHSQSSPYHQPMSDAKQSASPAAGQLGVRFHAIAAAPAAANIPSAATSVTGFTAGRSSYVVFPGSYSDGFVAQLVPAPARRASVAATSSTAAASSPELQLLWVQTLRSLSPLLDFTLSDVYKTGQPQIIACCGAASRGGGSLRIIRRAAPVASLGSTQHEPDVPVDDIFSIRVNPSHGADAGTDDEAEPDAGSDHKVDSPPPPHDALLISRSLDSTLVQTIPETDDITATCGLRVNIPTLDAGYIARGRFLVQITSQFGVDVTQVSTGTRVLTYSPALQPLPPPSQSAIARMEDGPTTSGAAASSRTVQVCAIRGRYVLLCTQKELLVLWIGLRTASIGVHVLSRLPLPGGEASTAHLFLIPAAQSQRRLLIALVGCTQRAGASAAGTSAGAESKVFAFGLLLPLSTAAVAGAAPAALTADSSRQLDIAPLSLLHTFAVSSPIESIRVLRSVSPAASYVVAGTREGMILSWLCNFPALLTIATSTPLLSAATAAPIPSVAPGYERRLGLQRVKLVSIGAGSSAAASERLLALCDEPWLVALDGGRVICVPVGTRSDHLLLRGAASFASSASSSDVFVALDGSSTRILSLRPTRDEIDVQRQIAIDTIPLPTGRTPRRVIVLASGYAAVITADPIPTSAPPAVSCAVLIVDLHRRCVVAEWSGFKASEQACSLLGTCARTQHLVASTLHCDAPFAELNHPEFGPVILVGTARNANGLVCRSGTIYALKFDASKPLSAIALAANQRRMSVDAAASAAAEAIPVIAAPVPVAVKAMDTSTDFIVPTPTNRQPKQSASAAADEKQSVSAAAVATQSGSSSVSAAAPSNPLSLAFEVTAIGMVQALALYQPPKPVSSADSKADSKSAPPPVYVLGSATEKVWLYRVDSGGLTAIARLNMRYVVVSIDVMHDAVAVTSQYDSIAIYRIAADCKSFIPIAVYAFALLARCSLRVISPRCVCGSDTSSRMARQGLMLATPQSVAESKQSVSIVKPTPMDAFALPPPAAPLTPQPIASASSSSAAAAAVASPVRVAASAPTALASAPYRAFGIDSLGAAFVVRDNPIVTPDSASSVSGALWLESQTERAFRGAAPTRIAKGSIAYTASAASGVCGVPAIVASTVAGAIVSFVPVTKREATILRSVQSIAGPSDSVLELISIFDGDRFLESTPSRLELFETLQSVKLRTL